MMKLINFDFIKTSRGKLAIPTHRLIASLNISEIVKMEIITNFGRSLLNQTRFIEFVNTNTTTQHAGRYYFFIRHFLTPALQFLSARCAGVASFAWDRSRFSTYAGISIMHCIVCQ